MLSDRARNFQSNFYPTFYNPLPFVVTSLFYTFIFAPPDTGGWLAHAQAVDTRPTSLMIVRPGIEANDNNTTTIALIDTAHTPHTRPHPSH